MRVLRARRALRTVGTAGLLWGVGACGGGERPPATRISNGDIDVATGPRLARLDADPLAAEADALVRAGRPWRATALLAAKLRAPASASPEARLAGARAAAAWEGWAEVSRILLGAPWLDRQFGGEGRELLARASLERGEDAVTDARLALDAARDDGSRVVRRVLLARAFDRANETDSAAAAYSEAASHLPRVADWLHLRAAGVLADSAARAAVFRRLSGGVARSRIASTDAQGRERTGDFAGAARSYQAAGDVGSAFRASALVARDTAAKGALAGRIVAYLGGTPASSEARQSIEVLDRLGVALTPAQELVVARAAATAGPAARAVTGFERVLRAGTMGAGSLSAPDRYAYAGALMRVGRARDAAAQYAQVATPPLAAAASYQGARALLAAGDGAGARAALRSTIAAHAGVASAAAPALLLLADLQIDDGDLGGAAASLAQIGARYPDAAVAPLARLRAGLIAWTRDPRAAAAIFDTLARRYPDDDETAAARYWAGRAHERAGNRKEAAQRWRDVIAASPLSYYAGLSADRLRVPGWSPPSGADTATHVAAVDSAVVRLRSLEQLGMEVERRLELDALAERAEREPAEAAAIAHAMLRVNEPARALRVAAKAMQHGTPTRALLRAAYPLSHPDALAEQARRNRLDAALVAGVIRQESSWNPRAVSPAGARGLMQLMPAVGADIARGRSYPLWNSALLYEPEVSLELGTSHLASSMPRGTPAARALAAYNAGASRVARWSRRPGAADPELFSEWIPFTETRDYVRIVQRNAEVYRALYGLR